MGLLGNARVDVSGETGGGTILVGGDFRGGNAAVQNAEVTWFGREASLDASARGSGDGGRVIVWADDTTRAFGTINARGGASTGNGGFVEVSGKRFLDYHARVSVSAPHGKGGTLLLDPDNLTIQNGAGNADGQLDGSADPQFLAADGPVNSTLDVAELTAGFTSGDTIRLEANNDINLGAGVAVGLQAGVNLTLVPNADGAGGGAFNFSGGSITLNNGTLSLAGPAPAMAWTGGTIGGPGTFSVPLGAVVNATGAGNRILFNVTVQNAGTWNIDMATGTRVSLDSSAIFNNNAGGLIAFLAAAGTNSIGSGGAATLNNFGTIRNAGAGTATIENFATSLAFTNSLGGTLSTTSTGQLRLQSAGGLTGTFSGLTNIVGDNVIFFGGTHNFQNGSVVTGRINQDNTAVLNFDGTTTTAGRYDIFAGTLNITNGTLTLAGGMNFDGGAITGGVGSPILAIPAGQTLNVTNDGGPISTMVVNNAGTIALNMNGGEFLSLVGSTLNNSGLIDFRSTVALTDNTIRALTTPSVINNNGIIRVSSATANGVISSGTTAGHDLTLNNMGGTLEETSASQSLILQTAGASFAANYSGQTTINGNSVSFASGTHTHTGTLIVPAGSSFNVTGGTHNFGNGSALQLADNLSYTGGAINFTGAGTGTTIPVGSTVTLAAARTFGGAGRLVNMGTLNLQGTSGINGAVDNQGSLNVLGNAQVDGQFDQRSGTLTISGGSTLTKNGSIFDWIGGSIGGAGTLALIGGATFQTSGTGARSQNGATLPTINNLSLPGGTLTVQSGTLNVTGTTTVSGGATLALTGGTFNTGGGDLDISGTVQADIPLSANQFTVRTGGALTGSNTVTGNTLVWSGGSLAGSGLKTFTNVSSSGTATLNSDLSLNGGTWTASGTLTMSGASRVLLSNAVINNGVGALWTVSSSAAVPIVGATGTTRFNNNGTYANTGAFDRTLTVSTFNTTGLTTVNAGSLTLNAANGADTGNYNVQGGGATLVFNSGRTFNAASNISGPGTVRFTSGNFSILGAYNIAAGTTEITGGNVFFNTGSFIDITNVLSLSAGSLRAAQGLRSSRSFAWSGGTISATAPFETTGTSTITGPATLFDSTWTNLGTVVESGASRVTLANNSVVNNSTGAFWNLQSSDASPITGSGTFSNAGTLRQLGAVPQRSIRLR